MICPNCEARMDHICPEYDDEYWHCPQCDSDWSECSCCEGFGYFGNPPENYERCEECDGSGLVFEE